MDEKTYKYKLGEKAEFFFDPTNKKKVLPGKVVEFTAKDLSSVRTKAAINSYHLVKVGNEPTPAEDQIPEKNMDSELERFKTAWENGGQKEVSNKFKSADLKALAEHLGFEIQDEDTKASLIEAITADLFPDE